MKKKLILFAIFMALCVVVLSVNGMSKSEVIPAGDSPYKSFTKTKNKCTKCSCKGYWGIKHYNGTYEGRCSNSDSHGHSCGHDPQHHGLRKY